MRVHLVKRGNKFQFCCRVPVDVLPYFPRPLIRKTLPAPDEKGAKLLATVLEYKTQQLFLTLRSAMLPANVRQHLVAVYMNSMLSALEAQATGQEFTGTPEDVTGASVIFDHYAAAGLDWFRLNKSINKHSPAEFAENRKAISHDIAQSYTRILADTGEGVSAFLMPELAKTLKKRIKIKLEPEDCQQLSLLLTRQDVLLNRVEEQILDGNWDELEHQRERVNRLLTTSFYDLKTVINSYMDYYINSKPNVKPGTKDDMAVECRTLLDIFGSIDINEFNTMAAVTKLKRTLLKYPKNKVQRYGDKSIHAIIKHERGYEIIGVKTANEYLKRAKAIIDYAGKEKLIQSANVYKGELFRVEVAEEEQRPAYDKRDIEQLVDALCTQPLWHYGEPKPERFWLILIALLHGLRLGNITSLKKSDIQQTDKGTWVFQLRTGKTKATVRPVPISDILLLLGFTDWVEELGREKLFQDTSSSASAWYNRDEKHHAGFEARHVTKDKGKCLYSLRHSFAGSVFNLTQDFKVTADMMGHSTGKAVTARYIKNLLAEKLKEITDKLQVEGLDLDRLEQRAQELFFTT
ncbi:MAG: hypothetical protein CXR31_12650 [Geobacter sp.]|nr:MAG: hypothetical protein CXR31_12650 [Geobacter sp.]